MTKRTLKVTLKIDLISDDQDFLDVIDDMPNEEFEQALNEVADNLDIKYEGIFYKIRDVKAQKLKK